MPTVKGLKKFLSQSEEFGCGFLVFRCFSRIFNILGLFLMFALGLKLFHIRLHTKRLSKFLSGNEQKSSDIRNGFCSKYGGTVTPLLDSCPQEENDEEQDEGEEDECYENKVFDVMSLRKMVRSERRNKKEALAELEKERIAAASAAEEAMAMILRLQNEKSRAEIQANQYYRMAEQKHRYDEEVIQSLEWVSLRLEEEKNMLEEDLNMFRQKLNMPLNEEEEEDFLSCNGEEEYLDDSDDFVSSSF